MSTSTTANMNLVLPTPTLELGPAWAYELNTALGLVDTHDHTPGKGVPITPAGINITTALGFNGQSASQVGAVLLAVQGADPTTTLSLYAKGVDLYYQDGNGNKIQITASGGVAGTPGSIGGLVSPASATYIAGTGTFQFKSGASLAANLDGATMVLRYPGSYPTPAGTNYIALEVPSSIAGGYALTLPAAPPTTNPAFLSMGTTGIVTTGVSQVQGITQSMLAPRGTANPATIGQIALGSPSGTFSATGAFPTAVPGASVTITTTGRPVVLMLTPSNVTPSYIGVSSSSGTVQGFFIPSRNAVPFAEIQIGGQVASGAMTVQVPPSQLLIDFPAAGTYTYSLAVSGPTPNVMAVNNCVLVAYEI